MASEELVIKSVTDDQEENVETDTDAVPLDGEDLVSDEKVVEEKHEFSSPWKRSDLILVVEDQKLHVHRSLLVMASPVFESILTSDFKERNDTEISLPGKKASEFVEFLRMIYQISQNITLSNVEYIYNLADEYQVQGVVDACRKILVLTKITNENAMEILVLAELCKAEEACKQCYDVLKELSLEELRTDQAFVRLDGQSVRNILLPKAERLEKCLKDVLPQMVGLIDCLLYLWLDPGTKNKMCGAPKQCSLHHAGTTASTSMKIRLKCDVCQHMFQQMVSGSTISRSTGKSSYYTTVNDMHFDENMVSILKEMHNLLKL